MLKDEVGSNGRTGGVEEGKGLKLELRPGKGRSQQVARRAAVRKHTKPCCQQGDDAIF